MTSLSATFKSTISTRKSIGLILDRVPLEMVNAIPEGQNNNIVWNAAHLIAVQQTLVNRRSGYQYTEDKFITKEFLPGTAPTGDLDKETVAHIKDRIVANALDMEKAYNDGLYAEYTPFETRTKIELATVEDAINFELMHTGLHLGYIISYLNVLRK